MNRKVKDKSAGTEGRNIFVQFVKRKRILNGEGVLPFMDLPSTCPMRRNELAAQNNET